jgi:hypothetical protein
MSCKSKASSINGSPSELDPECIEELRLTLDQLKNPRRNNSQKSFSIQEALHEKHQKAQSIKEAQKRQQKSLDLQKFSFKPEISQKSRKISEPRHRQQVLKIIEKYKKAENPDDEKPLRPRDAIPPPEHSSVKVLFNSRAGLEKVEKKCEENPLKLGIVQKTKFFERKKNEDLIREKEEKNKNLLKECTFKPDLGKSVKRRKSVELFTEICITEEKGKGDEVIRPPAPNPKIKKKKESQSVSRKGYNQISPDDQIYSFREGINMDKLLEKSKPMLKYKVANNPY